MIGYNITTSRKPIQPAYFETRMLDDVIRRSSTEDIGLSERVISFQGLKIP